MPHSPLVHVYLSPHLDDAALSCGGIIHHQTTAGERVVVVTVCAGDPPPGALSEFACELHRRWFPDTADSDPGAAVAARRAEDLTAMELLGAEAIHLNIPDCIYRRHPLSGLAAYASQNAIYGELPPFESVVVRRLANKLSALVRSLGRYRLYAPLAIGHHVDHQLTHQAAEAVGSIYAYFEDYPYVAGEKHLPSLGETEIISLTEADVAAKISAIAAYASQISSFWQDSEHMALAVRQHLMHNGNGQAAERLRRRRKPFNI